MFKTLTTGRICRSIYHLCGMWLKITKLIQLWSSVQRHTHICSWSRHGGPSNATSVSMFTYPILVCGGLILYFVSVFRSPRFWEERVPKDNVLRYVNTTVSESILHIWNGCCHQSQLDSKSKINLSDKGFCFQPRVFCLQHIPKK